MNQARAKETGGVACQRSRPRHQNPSQNEGAVTNLLTLARSASSGQPNLPARRAVWERPRPVQGQVACQLRVEPAAVVSVEPLLSQSAWPAALVVAGVGLTALEASNVNERVGELTVIEST